jgi:hypothetical protein
MLELGEDQDSLTFTAELMPHSFLLYSKQKCRLKIDLLWICSYISSDGRAISRKQNCLLSAFGDSPARVSHI